MRNGVYFDTISFKKNGLIFWLNRGVYMSLLFVLSFAFNKFERYRLLCGAVQDGLAGQLGENERFPAMKIAFLRFLTEPDLGGYNLMMEDS